MRYVAAIAALMMVAACAGPKADIPPAAAVHPPDAWRSAPKYQGDVTAEWWKGFSDPLLAAIVERALAHNDDIAIAAGRVAEARAQFHFARAQTFPDLESAGEFDRSRSVNPAFGTPLTQTEGVGVVQISYDIDLFGRLADTEKSARALLLASEAAQENVRLAIAAAAAGGYITLRGLDARLAILRDTLAARGGELHVIARRTGAGYSTQLDLAQAQAAYHDTEQLIPATQLAVSHVEDGLSVLLGDTPEAIERGLSFDKLSAPAVPVTMPSRLLRRRPDILEAEQELAAADHQLDATRAAFLPDIELAPMAGVAGSNLIKGNTLEIWSLGGSVLAPLFTAGRLEAQQDTATARRDQAAFAYRKTVLVAFQEVEDSEFAVQRDEEQERDLAAERDSLAHALAIATHRYREGYSPYLDQLDAERDLLVTQLALVQARSDRFNALVTLYQSLGGGWSAEAILTKHGAL